MKHFERHLFLSFRVLMYIFFPMLIVYASIVELNPSGTRRLEYRVGQTSSLVSQFFPAQRLTKPLDGSQVMLQEPVYVTARYPHRYDRVVVTVDVDNPSDLDWRIGIARGAGSWSYEVVQPDTNGSASFDLAGARVTDGRLRFMVSVPRGIDEDLFALGGVTIDLHRESLLQTVQRKFSF